MIKVKDVMSTNVISVKKDDSIFDAVELLVEKQLSGLPVIEDDMTLVGLLSEKDVVDIFCDLEEAEDKTVGDFMTHPAVSFDENDALLKVCNFLEKNIFRRIPITSGDKLTGIVSIHDILRTILGSRSLSE
jgi:CBS domain-containing protein